MRRHFRHEKKKTLLKYLFGFPSSKSSCVNLAQVLQQQKHFLKCHYAHTFHAYDRRFERKRHFFLALTFA